jgi:hypothetical protein
MGFPGTTVKHCAYGHSVATLLNPRGVKAVYHRQSDMRNCVVVAVPSNVHSPANYKTQIYYLRRILTVYK